MQIDSAVIAAVVAAIVGLFMSKREAKLKHITEERGKWREKIRDIAGKLAALSSKDLPDDKKPDVNILLAELKVRINAYGINLINPPNHDEAQKITERYKNDGHIWQAIRNIEAGIEVNENVSRLVDYLSLMLKHDWDRAKYEVSGISLFTKKAVVFALVYSATITLICIGLCVCKVICAGQVFSMICNIVIAGTAGALVIIIFIHILCGIIRKEHEDDKYIECLKEYDRRHAA